MNPTKETLFELIKHEDYKIHMRNAGIFRFPAGYSFAEHIQPEVEIVYMNSGNCIASAGGNQIPLKQGECLVVQPYVKHGYTIEAQVPYSVTELEYSMVLPKEVECPISFLTNEEPYYKISDCQTVCNIMTNICRYYRQSPITDAIQTQIELGFAQLFLELSNHLEGTRGKTDKTGGAVSKISAIVRYLKENYENDIQLEAVAEQFHISSRYLRKYFSKEMGVNCNQYLTMIRLEKAKELLWNTTKSITEIAMMTGFNSSQYFSRVFRKNTGVRPHEFRNMWRGQIADVSYRISEEH